MLTDRQKDLIKESWKEVLEKEDKVTEVFYPTFFMLNPNAKKLFRNDLEMQLEKFIKMISFIVAKINELDNIQDELSFLSKKHYNFGVKLIDFRDFETAFFEMLQQIIQYHWNYELETAWRNIFKYVLESMKVQMEEQQRMTMDKYQAASQLYHEVETPRELNSSNRISS